MKSRLTGLKELARLVWNRLGDREYKIDDHTLISMTQIILDDALMEIRGDHTSLLLLKGGQIAPSGTMVVLVIRMLGELVEKLGNSPVIKASELEGLIKEALPKDLSGWNSMIPVGDTFTDCSCPNCQWLNSLYHVPDLETEFDSLLLDNDEETSELEDTLGIKLPPHGPQTGLVKIEIGYGRDNILTIIPMKMLLSLSEMIKQTFSLTEVDTGIQLTKESLLDIVEAESWEALAQSFVILSQKGSNEVKEPEAKTPDSEPIKLKSTRISKDLAFQLSKGMKN